MSVEHVPLSIVSTTESVHGAQRMTADEGHGVYLRGGASDGKPVDINGYLAAGVWTRMRTYLDARSQ